MKIIARFALYFFIPFTCFAQQNKIDSLLVITIRGNALQQANAFNALCNTTMYDNPALAKTYAQNAIEISKKNNYKAALGDGYTRLGVVYDVSGKYDSSIFYYNLALPIYEDLKNLKGRGSANNNLGLVYWNQGSHEKALSYFYLALADFEEIKNEKFTANALNNIGLVYNDIKQYRQSLQYHFKAKAVYEKINDAYLTGAVYSNIGNCYSNLGKLDSAELFFTKAIEMQTKADDDYGLSIAYNGYAGLLMDKGKYNEALDFFSKTLLLKDKLDEKVGQSSVLIQMSKIYKHLGNTTKELDCLTKAKTIAEENKFNRDLISIYTKLSSFYEKTNTPLAFEFYKKYSSIKDSVFNETSNQQITELNTKYETSKKEQQLIVQQNQINRKNYLISGISIAALLLSLYGFTFYKKRQAQNKLALQTEVIKQQDLATKAVLEAEEKERQRIARDLHDGVGQVMSAAKMNLSAFENELVFKDEQQKLSFEKVINLVDEGCKEVRNVSHQMMPNALLKAGLASAVKEFIDKIDNRILKVNLYSEGLNERLDNNVEIVLYRVIQECVNNVIKHSGANQLDISLIKDSDGISATIEDNGKGFNATEKATFEGIGLKNIQLRVEFLKGTVDFDSAEGKGTLVAIHVPLV